MGIRIYPLGGLGNQLFTYGVGLRVSTELGLPLEADNRAFLADSQRRYELSSFSNSIAKEFCSRRPVRLPVIGRLVGGLRTSGLFRAHRIIDDRGDWQTALSTLGSCLHQPRSVKLRGYFQDFGAFSNYRALLQRQTADVLSPTEHYPSLLADLSEQDFISVHVRLGDFRYSPEQNVLQHRYYTRALDAATRCWGERQVFVFSDEPPRARRMPSLRHLKNESFIELGAGRFPPSNGSGLRPIETLNLMSQASVSIGANSTFSLWAAWLSQKNQNRVIVPRPFSRKISRDERFLIPEEWLSIGG